MCPICQKLINGKGSYLKPGKLICHCLLIEHGNRLCLVDTGFGLQDIAKPTRRLGLLFNQFVRPKLNRSETAHDQLKALGFKPEDVTDIFPTHMDLDHIGGLNDFPQATVHIYQTELQHAQQPSLKERLRYKKSQFSSHQHWQVYDTPRQQWFGLDCFDCSSSLGFSLHIVPLTGHSHGHVGVAVQYMDHWLLHCGDAYFHHSQVSNQNTMPALLSIVEKQLQSNAKQRRSSLEKLKQLKRNHPEIKMFCAHDVTEFEQFL